MVIYQRNKQALSWSNLCKRKEGDLGFRHMEAFNNAWLAKQCWRLPRDQHLLVARVLKARYFPEKEILEADLGPRPSCVWRSILGGSKCDYAKLKMACWERAIYKCLDGRWLPFPRMFRVITPK